MFDASFAPLTAVNVYRTWLKVLFRTQMRGLLALLPHESWEPDGHVLPWGTEPQANSAAWLPATSWRSDKQPEMIPWCRSPRKDLLCQEEPGKRVIAATILALNGRRWSSVAISPILFKMKRKGGATMMSLLEGKEAISSFPQLESIVSSRTVCWWRECTLNVKDVEVGPLATAILLFCCGVYLRSIEDELLHSNWWHQALLANCTSRQEKKRVWI